MHLSEVLSWANSKPQTQTRSVVEWGSCLFLKNFLSVFSSFTDLIFILVIHAPWFCYVKVKQASGTDQMPNHDLESHLLEKKKGGPTFI